MSKCFNKECDYCKDNECRFGREDNAGCHWYIGEPLKEPLSKKFQDYAEEELPKLREQIEQKDQRIAELEKENEEKEDKILDLKSYNSDLKETISKLSFSAVRCQAINDEVCQYILDNELLKKENAELKEVIKLAEQENAELKAKLQNAIVPKFKVGDKVYVVINEKQIKEFTIRIIESGIFLEGEENGNKNNKM
jgi:predicted RNase H-like nuclease (RuvC/YqgF family)